jgi:excisionase family DNA binding protein
VSAVAVSTLFRLRIGRGRTSSSLKGKPTMPFHPNHPSRARRPHPAADAHQPTATPQTAAPEADATLLYTPAEAAQLLKVRESWLRKKAAARTIPCTFLGKHLRFSPTDLTAIITGSAQPAVGRRPRRRSGPSVRDRDLPPPPDRRVHAPHDDHNPQGSSTWHG